MKSSNPKASAPVTKSAAEWEACVRLALAPGIGALIFKRLVERYGGPLGVFKVPDSKLGRYSRLVSAARGQGIDHIRPSETICWADADYPQLLREIPDPPPILWYKGRRPKVHRPRVAIVGTRKATTYGRQVAADMARQLSEVGIEVVSGLALGVDGAAHRGALEGGAGTIAVLGSGVDRIFPSLHRELATRVETDGTVLSEFPPGTPASPGHFPRRNRIISGLCQATVVVEARKRGGALITASLAISQDRAVYAVPGNVGRPSSAGTNALIEIGSGALLLDIKTLIQKEWPSLALSSAKLFSPVDAQHGHEKLLECLKTEPCGLDRLCLETGKNVSDLLVELLDLELAGLVRQYAGKQFGLAV